MGRWNGSLSAKFAGAAGAAAYPGVASPGAFSSSSARGLGLSLAAGSGRFGPRNWTPETQGKESGMGQSLTNRSFGPQVLVLGSMCIPGFHYPFLTHIRFLWLVALGMPTNRGFQRGFKVVRTQYGFEVMVNGTPSKSYQCNLTDRGAQDPFAHGSCCS